MNSLLNFPEVKSNVYLANVLKFESFQTSPRFLSLIIDDSLPARPIRYDVVHKMITSFRSYYSKKVVDDVISMHQGLLLNVSFDVLFSKYLTETYKNNLKPELIKNDVFQLVQNVDVSDMDKLVEGVRKLPDDTFLFGKKLFTYDADFKVDVFKNDMSFSIPKYFYTFFYYKHLIYRASMCTGDVQCQRLYNLGQYIFVYYTIMSLFLIVFGTSENTSSYIQATKISLDEAQALKFSMTSIMDGILLRLQEKSLLNISGGLGATNLQNQVAQASNQNVAKSQEIVMKQVNIKHIQNNLSSYNTIEAMSHRQLAATRIKYWVYIVILAIVMLGVIATTLSGNYLVADIISLIVVVAIVSILFNWHTKAFGWLHSFFTD